ncbi:MAG: DUF4468 domain-containing protein [Bacteroidales bacterium]|nr:DUF4468 domain-containing protein [Bacteroidales bacterium]
MKNRTFFIICLFSGFFFGLQTAFSQEIPVMPLNPNTNKIEYSGVVQVEGTADELYVRCIAWINTFFNNASSVTKVRDRNNTLIEGVHRIRILNKLEDGTELFAGHVQYDFKLQFRDGRFRYEINNFSAREMSRSPIEKWLDKNDPSFTTNTPYHLEQIDKFVKDLIKDMTEGMQPKVEVNEEW